jgi:major membrane immunogen (membrane-anchored lipoprotein)
MENLELLKYGGLIMKKELIAMLLISVISFTGCGNKQIFDTKFTFTKAKIVMGNETIEVNVKSWKDYENDTQMQIISEDGTVYLVDKANILLIGK